MHYASNFILFSLCSCSSLNFLRGLFRIICQSIYLFFFRANYWSFSGGSEDKESVCSTGDLGSVPGSGRYPGEGNGNPLQCSCLESPMAGGLVGYSPGGCGVGHNWATLLHYYWSFINFLWWCHVSLIFVIFVAFIVCAFKKVAVSSSLYSLALEGKALHQSACPEILSKASGGVHRCLLLEFSDRQVVPGSAGDHTWCLDPQGWFLRQTTFVSGFTGVDQVLESVMVSLGPESVWEGLDPGSVPASLGRGDHWVGLASGSTGAGLVLGQA